MKICLNFLHKNILYELILKILKSYLITTFKIRVLFVVNYISGVCFKTINILIFISMLNRLNWSENCLKTFRNYSKLSGNPMIQLKPKKNIFKSNSLISLGRLTKDTNHSHFVCLTFQLWTPGRDFYELLTLCVLFC